VLYAYRSVQISGHAEPPITLLKSKTGWNHVYYWQILKALTIGLEYFMDEKKIMPNKLNRICMVTTGCIYNMEPFWLSGVSLRVICQFHLLHLTKFLIATLV
jgi:hypothetical protein